MALLDNPVYASITKQGTVALCPPNSYYDPGNETMLEESVGAARQLTSAWQRGEITTKEVAWEHIRLISEEVASGYVPWDVHNFHELHDYVDANKYVLELIGYDGTDEGIVFINAVQGAVNRLLTGGLDCPNEPGCVWKQQSRAKQ
jgi:hypothetical protein